MNKPDVAVSSFDFDYWKMTHVEDEPYQIDNFQISWSFIIFPAVCHALLWI